MLELHLQIQITGCYHTEANLAGTLNLDPSPLTHKHTHIPGNIDEEECNKKPEVCVSLVIGL